MIGTLDQTSGFVNVTPHHGQYWIRIVDDPPS